MSNKKKIAILLPSMGSGGAEKVMSLFLQKLAQDYKVYLMLFFNNIHHPIPDNVELICISEKKILTLSERIFLMPKIIRKYISLIKQEEIEISFSMLTLPNFINGITKIFSPSVKTIASERNYPSIEYNSSQLRFRLYKILIPFFYNKIDFLFSNSIHINEDLKNSFKVTKKINVIYNPILQTDNFLEKIELNPDDYFRLIHAGRFIPVKNHEMLLKAIEQIQKPVQLDLLGEGELWETIKKSTVDRKISHKVNFLGNVKDVHAYLVKSQCFIFSSLSEGFPNALLEAMSAGLPVISANCFSGPLELLNNNKDVIIPLKGFIECEFGILVNIDDSEGLAGAIEFLMSHPDRLQYYCLQSRKRAADFSLDVIYRELKKIIEI